MPQDLGPSPPPPVSSAPGIAPFRVRLLSAGFWSFFGRGLAIGLFFLSDMVLARASKSAFASMYMATSLATFISVFASLGADQLFTRVVRQTFYGPNPERTLAVIRAGTRLLLVGATVASGIFILGLPSMIDFMPWLFDADQWKPLRDFPVGVVLWGCLLGACTNSAFALQGLDDFRSAIMIGSRRGGLLPNSAFLVFTVVLWQLGYISAAALITAQCVFQAMALIYGQFVMRRQVARFAPVQMTAAQLDSGAPGLTAAWFFRESLPYFVAVMSQMVIDEFDAVIVGAFIDGPDFANYAAARRLVRVMNMAFVMFAISMGPFVAELIGKGELKRLERIMRASATFLCIPMLCILSVYVFAPEFTLRLAGGPGYEGGALTLQLLTIGQVIFVVMGSSGQTLFMAGKQRTLMLCSLASLVFYCTAAPMMISNFGIAGAALTQSAIVALQAVALTLLAKRQVGIWTAATLSPAALRDSLRALAGRRRGATSDLKAVEAQEAASDAALSE
jgi:O-antigen/teichoic acid export membrane protein